MHHGWVEAALRHKQANYYFGAARLKVVAEL